MRPTKYERFIKRAVVQSYGVASWLHSWMGPVWALLGNTFDDIRNRNMILIGEIAESRVRVR